MHMIYVNDMKKEGERDLQNCHPDASSRFKNCAPILFDSSSFVSFNVTRQLPSDIKIIGTQRRGEGYFEHAIKILRNGKRCR